MTKAGYSSNFKYSKYTLDKFKSRKLSAEALANIKKAKDNKKVLINSITVNIDSKVYQGAMDGYDFF